MSSFRPWRCPICIPIVNCVSEADRKLHEAGKKHQKRKEKLTQAKGGTEGTQSSVVTHTASVSPSSVHISNPAFPKSQMTLPQRTTAAGVSNSKSTHAKPSKTMSMEEHMRKIARLDDALDPSGIRSVLDCMGVFDETIRDKPNLRKSGGHIPRRTLVQEHNQMREGYLEIFEKSTGHSMHSLRPPKPKECVASREKPGDAVSLLTLRANLDEILPRRHILLRTLVLPARLSSVMVIAEDGEGNEDRVAFYNCFDDFGDVSILDRLLPIGTGLLILNPWLKRSRDGWRTLRVDQPADVIFLRTDEELFAAGWPRRPTIEITLLEQSLEEELRSLKDRGNEEFDREECSKCIETYTRAIYRLPESGCKPACASSPELPDALRSLCISLLGNRSEAYLFTSQFGLALRDAVRVLSMEPGQEKAVCRRLRALKGLELYDQMKMDPLCSSTNQQIILKDVPRLLKEQQGKWHLATLLEESRRLAVLLTDTSSVPMTMHEAACVKLGAHATYVHPQLVVGAPIASTATGRGVLVRNTFGNSLLNQRIPAYTYVVSEKAVDVWYRYYTTNLRRVDVRADTFVEFSHHRWLKRALLKRCAANPNLAHALSLLDAGPGFEDKRKELLAKYPSALPLLSELLSDDSNNSPTSLDPEQASHLIRRRALAFHMDSSTVVSDSAKAEDQQLLDVVTYGLWFVAAQFNHSCRPNCIVSVVGDQLFIRTIRDILPGEELTVSILSMESISRTYRERQAALQTKGLQCACGWCEVFQVHPELECIEDDLIHASDRLCKQTNLLARQLAKPGLTEPMIREVKDKLQRTADSGAQMCVNFRVSVSNICSDECKSGHTQPSQGAASCLLVHLARPLMMQSFIYLQLHMKQSSDKKVHSQWRRHQSLLCEEAARLVAHVEGTGNIASTRMAVEPTVGSFSHFDSSTAIYFKEKLKRVAEEYQQFYDVPMPKFGLVLQNFMKEDYFKREQHFSPHPLPTFLKENDNEYPSTSNEDSNLAPNSSTTFGTGSLPIGSPVISSIAEAAANVQKCFTLLLEPLRRYLIAQPNAEPLQLKLQRIGKMDISECLKRLQSHPDASLAKIVKAALKLRNRVSHQSLGAHDGRQGLLILKQLAHAVSADEVETQIDRLIPTIPKQSAAQVLAGEAIDSATRLLKSGQYTESANVITKVLDSHSGNTLPIQERAALHVARARANFERERWQVTREDAEQATLLCPKDADASLVLVKALQRLELFAEGACECERILSFQPHHTELLLLARECGAGIQSKSNQWHSSKLPLPHCDPEVMKVVMDRTNQEHAKRKPAKEDVHIITDAELKTHGAQQIKTHRCVRDAHHLRDGTNGFLKNERDALKRYEMAAKLGSAEGLYMAGVFYADGRGCILDHAKALDCWRAAVQQKPWYRYDKTLNLPVGTVNLFVNIGVRESENSIGNAYRDGVGVDVNQTEAAKWYVKGAEHGDAAAMNNLGVCLLSGRGLPRDEIAARRWYKQAADSREPTPAEAMMNYADLCRRGVGGVKNLSEALTYYQLAASRGYPGAAENVQQLKRSTHPAVGAPDGPILNPELSDTWFLKATNCHHGAGECQGKIDLEQAAIYYRKAADMKHLQASTALAFLFEDELKQPRSAFEAWLRAAEDGNPAAYGHLATCYAFGHGTSRNEKKATMYRHRFEANIANIPAWIRFERMPPEKSKMPPLDYWLKAGRDLCDWEASKKLGIDGFTCEERFHRQCLGELGHDDLSPSEQAEIEMLRTMLELENAPPIRLGNDVSRPGFDWTVELEDRANAGFKVAQQVIQCQNMHSRGAIQLKRFLLLQSMDRTNPEDFRHPFAQLPESKLHSILHNLRVAYRLYDLPHFDPFQVYLFNQLAEEALQRDSTHADALFWLAKHFPGSTEEQVQRWEQLIELHPHDSDAQHNYGCLNGFGDNPDWELLVHHVRLAVQCDKDVGVTCPPSWYYDIGTGLRLQVKDESHSLEAIHEYERYLSIAAIDDRKVPEAHYCIGLLSYHNSERALQQWFKGQYAERWRLPCLYPVDDRFPPKMLLKMRITELINSSATADPSTACSTCRYNGSLSLRRCCELAIYCDKECQKRDWKEHRTKCLTRKADSIPTTSKNRRMHQFQAPTEANPLAETHLGNRNSVATNGTSCKIRSDHLPEQKQLHEIKFADFEEKNKQFSAPYQPSKGERRWGQAAAIGLLTGSLLVASATWLLRVYPAFRSR